MIRVFFICLFIFLNKCLPSHGGLSSGVIVYVHGEKETPLILIAVSLYAAVVQFFTYTLPTLYSREHLCPLCTTSFLYPSQ